MTLPQKKFRELVFQLLYSEDLGKPNPEEIILLMMDQLKVTKKNAKIAYEKAKEILLKKELIDPQITKAALGYEFQRIPSVERNILRLGLYEMLYDDRIPPKVAIAEAVRLSKKFSTKEAASFINAILDAIYHQKENKEKDKAIDLDKVKESISLFEKSLKANPPKEE